MEHSFALWQEWTRLGKLNGWSSYGRTKLFRCQSFGNEHVCITGTFNARRKQVSRRAFYIRYHKRYFIKSCALLNLESLRHGEKNKFKCLLYYGKYAYYITEFLIKRSCSFARRVGNMSRDFSLNFFRYWKKYIWKHRGRGVIYLNSIKKSLYALNKIPPCIKYLPHIMRLT